MDKDIKIKRQINHHNYYYVKIASNVFLVMIKNKSIVLFVVLIITISQKNNAISLTIDQLKSISKSFRLTKTFKIPSSLNLDQSPIKLILYGHHAIGFFKSNNWKLLNNSHISIDYIPLTYKFSTNFKIIDQQGKTHHLTNVKHQPKYPDIFNKVKIKIASGLLTNPFYLLNGALPRELLTNAQFSSNNPELFRKNLHRFTYLMIINRFGEIVWLHIPIVANGLSSSYISSKRVGQGFYGLMFGKQAGHFEIVRYDGSIFREFSSKDIPYPFVMHHDFETMGSTKLYAVGNELIKMSKYSKDPAYKNKTFISDTIIGIDLINKKSKRLMGFLKYFNPKKTPFYTGDPPNDKKFVIWGKKKADIDFLHINGVDYIPEKKGVLVSFRNISKVGLIDSKFTKILWTIGGQKSDDFYIASKADRFNHQHTPFFTSKNKLIMFDNGVLNQRSRVVQYQLDKNTKSAKLVWEYSPKPDLFAKDRSSVYQVDNNTIGVLFVNPKYPGQKLSAIPHRDYYYELDLQSKKEKAKVVISYPVATPGYRVIPISSINNDSLYNIDQESVNISLKD